MVFTNRDDALAFATVSPLTKHDRTRLLNISKGITRIIYNWNDRTNVEAAIKQSNIIHGPFKKIGGSCGSVFYVTIIINAIDH